MFLCRIGLLCNVAMNIEPIMANINNMNRHGLKPKRKLSDQEARNIVFELMVSTVEKSNKAEMVKFARE
jgi:hypothetical protein